MAAQCKCCCGKCHYALTCDDCCGCVPKQICVSVVGNGTGCSCVGTSFSVADFDCSTKTWSGVVYCGDITFDYSVYIQADSYGQCYLYLESDCLSSTLQVALRAPLSNPADEYGPTCRNISGTWTEVSHTCGDAACTSLDISVSAADRLVVPPETCQTDCLDCECICKNLCITYSSDDCIESVVVEGALVDGVPTWDFEIYCGSSTVTGTITLECYNGSHVLSLTSSEGDGDDVAQENCPDLNAAWYVSETVTISANCTECGGCGGFDFGCCVLQPCPTSLTVSFCDCDLTINLDNLGGCDSWGGSPSCNGETWNIDVDCFNSDNRIPADDIYRLKLGCDAMSPNQAIAYATQTSCDPFIVVFQMDMGNYTGVCTECDGEFPVVVTG